jgi:hypothetical protein
MTIPNPDPLDSLESYLERLNLLGRGFAYGEIVDGSRRKSIPPRIRWGPLAIVIEAANRFRALAIAEAGVKGLRINAAYRAHGGASNSAHKYGRALDLDRIGGDGAAYFRCAVKFWCSGGCEGLGLYTWTGLVQSGTRVHIDIGHGVRSWQGIRSGFGRPWTVDGDKVGLPVKLAHDMGLTVPTTRRAA